MVRPVSNSERRCFVLVVVLALACGPDVAQTDGGTGTSTGDDASSTGTPTGSSTGVPGPCGLVHEGDLNVYDDTDLASLTDLGRVTGFLGIYMEGRDQRDLSFLSCLHTVDGGLYIANNTLLESTDGLENLKDVAGLRIRDNDNLRVVEFDQIRDLQLLEVYKNPALEELQFEALETVKYLVIGRCAETSPDARHFALAGLSGFSSLTNVESLTLEGNEVLMSVDLFDALDANGAAAPMDSAGIRFNPLLPEAVINARLDALGVQYREVCGNADGDPDCYCEVGE